jgi:predicted translin family RNA/ssDNA-binding protein
MNYRLHYERMLATARKAAKDTVYATMIAACIADDRLPTVDDLPVTMTAHVSGVARDQIVREMREHVCLLLNDRMMQTLTDDKLPALIAVCFVGGIAKIQM